MLIDTFDDNEYNQFFKQLLNKFNQRNIVNYFVTNLLKHSIKETDYTYYNQLNQIISNIISSRKKNQSNTMKSIKQSTTKTITNLPSAMISECASYLPFKEIIKFQTCGKFIYYFLKN